MATIARISSPVSQCGRTLPNTNIAPSINQNRPVLKRRLLAWSQNVIDANIQSTNPVSAYTELRLNAPAINRIIARLPPFVDISGRAARTESYQGLPRLL